MQALCKAGLLLLLASFSIEGCFSFPYHGQEQFLQALLQDAHNRHQRSSNLKIDTITKSKIQGTYRDSVTGEGIHFSTSVNENGGGEMTIATLQGEPIVVAKQSHSDGAKLMSVEGEHFLITKHLHSDLQSRDKRETASSEFVVSNTHLQEVQDAIQDRSGAHVSRILKHLDSTTADTKREKALRNLIGRAEIQHLINAAKALGKSGVSGKDNDAAREFYVYAMRLEGARMKAGLPVQRELHVTSNLARIENGPYCPAAEQNCPEGKCPQSRGGCHGLCGPSCFWCWSWICGDCCYHQGCADHDDCCEKRGYSAWACFAAPFNGFTCDGPYNC